MFEEYLYLFIVIIYIFIDRIFVQLKVESFISYESCVKGSKCPLKINILKVWHFVKLIDKLITAVITPVSKIGNRQHNIT